jgi:type II secretory pathway component PulF
MRNALERRKTKRLSHVTIAPMRFSSKNLAVFYYQLGMLVQAGLPIQSVLTSARKTAPRSMRPTVAALSALVDQGTPLSDAMEQHARRFAPLDRHNINMTERSGALDIGLLSLSKYYEARTAARRTLIVNSIQPVMLLMAGTFIPPLPAFILGKITAGEYLGATAGVLAGQAVTAWLISLLVRWSFRVPKLNLVMDRLLLAIPVLGRLRFDYALSQWVSSVRLMLRAGIGIVPALEYASRTVPSPLIADGYKRAAPLIGGQLEVSQALASTGVFPDQLTQFWATGEQSGKMDEMLDRLVQFYEERWRNSLEQTAIWIPRIIYLLMVLNMGFGIVTMAAAYFGKFFGN